MEKLKLSIAILYILSIILIISLFLVLFKIYNIYSLNKEVDINTDELNETEKQVVYDVLDELKIDYYFLARKIVFVKDLKELGNEYYNTNGLNKDNGDIYIEYNGNKNVLKYVLCHELIHSLGFKENEEFYVRDIAFYGVCYE